MPVTDTVEANLRRAFSNKTGYVRRVQRKKGVIGSLQPDLSA
jgi:hypothetical protein